MAKFIYTVKDNARTRTLAQGTIDPEKVFHPLPDSYKDPYHMKEHVEACILKRWPWCNVQLYMMVEEWEPATHVRKKKEEEEDR